MHSTLGGFPALSAIEPSLQPCSQRRVRQHAGDTYRGGEGKKPPLVGCQCSHPGDHDRSRQRSQRSEECNTPAGPCRDHLSTEQVTRRTRTPRTDRSRPGISGGHRQARSNDPEAWSCSEERPGCRHPAVGQHLPLVAAGALCPHPTGGIRAYPRYDTASYKESEERSPTREPGSYEDGTADRGRGQGAEPGQGVEAEGEQSNGPTDQKAGRNRKRAEGRCKGIDRLIS
jgi:hypothetical protein